MNEGWIKLHRSLVSWEWFSDSRVTHLFLYIMLNASHNEYKWKGKKFKSGQMPFGRNKASLETGLSIQNIRTALKKLELTNEITIDSNRQGTVITVVNWNKYQGLSVESTNVLTNVLTNDQPTTNQRLTTTKNVKNEKNVKNTSAKKKYTYSEDLIILFSDEEIITWLKETGSKKSQDALYSKYENISLVENIEAAFNWKVENNKKRNASTFLTGWFNNGFHKIPMKESYKDKIIEADLIALGFDK